MHDYSLVLNAGSSSLKFCVFERSEEEDWRIESRGQIEGVGTSPRLSARDGAGKAIVDRKLDPQPRDVREALDVLADWLRSRYHGVRVLGVGHRIAHGGKLYSRPTTITPDVLAELHKLSPLAPLHQPYNLAAVEAVSHRLPGVPQVACFDTGFHRTMPAVAELVPLPREIRDGGVQRYGFHGISYEYIAHMLPTTAPQIANGRVIVAHLGSGASLCALKNGKSVDSSFGFTPLDGLCMGTRPGALDPGVVLHLFHTLGLSSKDVETMLYKKSGLIGISGISNDMRVLLESSEPAAQLAVDYFVYQARKEIGALAGILGGIDGLVFTAGIGENSPEIRRRICESCGWLGIDLDPEGNAGKGPRISTRESRISVWVIPTNEEKMIAWHTGMVLGLIEAHV